MATFRSLVPTAAVALVLSACGGSEPANLASAPTPAAKTPPAAPTLDALVSLEKGAFEAWKTRDAAFWNSFLAESFVGYGPSGRLDKAAAAIQFTGTECEIASYAVSDARTRTLGEGVALLTYTATVDGTCGGEKVPPSNRAATVYVLDDGRWKATFNAEAPIVDPSAGPAKPVGVEGASIAVAASEAPRDAAVDAMVEAEKTVWEAWRRHDGEWIEKLTTSDLSFINIFGTYFANQADALKDWTSPGCDVQSVSVTNAVGKLLSPTVGILTFQGGADGTCFGQEIGPIWGTSIYVRQGDAWKWTFGINLPAPPAGE